MHKQSPVEAAAGIGERAIELGFGEADSLDLSNMTPDEIRDTVRSSFVDPSIDWHKAGLALWARDQVGQS